MHQQNKLKFDMVSRASHRIGALLTVIKEGVSLVEEETAGAINVTQRKSLLFSQRAVNRLTQVICDLIDLEKILEGEIKPRREKVRFWPLIKEAAESMRPEAALKDISLSDKLPSGSAETYIDRDKIFRAVVNLAEDIIKYTPPGGSINISGTRNEMLDVSIKSNRMIKGIAGYANLPSIDGRIEDLLKDNKISLNIIIAKALIENEGGTIRLFGNKDNANEIIFSLPGHKQDNQ